MIIIVKLLTVLNGRLLWQYFNKKKERADCPLPEIFLYYGLSGTAIVNLTPF